MIRRAITGLLLAALAAAPAMASGGHKLPRVTDSGWVQPYGPAVDLDFAHLNGDGTYGRCYVAGKGVLPLDSCLQDSTRTTQGMANWADGHWSNFAPLTLKMTDLGLRTDSGQTNVVLWSNDLTQSSVWTLSNATAVLNQTGNDNVPNSASTLTATGANATALQAITTSSVNRAGSVFLKRLSGSGEVDATIDGGTTWQACTLTLNVWVRCFGAATITSTTYTVGERLVVNGDSVAVWDNQLEATLPGAPKLTGALTVAENTNKPFLTPAALTAISTASPWTMFARAVAFNPYLSTTSGLAEANDGTVNNRCGFRTNSTLKGNFFAVIAGSTIVNGATTNSGTSGSSLNTAAICKNGDYVGALNNGTLATGSAAGTLAALTQWSIGVVVNVAWGSTIARVTIWNGRLTNTQMQVLK